MDGDREITYGVDISNHFCDYFSSVGTNIGSNIPPSNIDFLLYMPQSNPHFIFACPVDAVERENVLRNLEIK